MTDLKKSPVAIVMPVALQRGGCETMLLSLLRANKEDVNVPYTVCFLEDGPMVLDVEAMGYSAHVITVGRLRQLHRYLISVFRLAAWLRTERATQAISFMEKAHLYTSPAAKLAQVPAAWWLHSIDPNGKLLGFIASLPANHVFSDSQAALDLQNPRWRRHPSSVHHCAVDLSRFDVAAVGTLQESRQQLGLPIDRPIVGVVARLQRWKGVDVFIRAAAQILNRFTQNGLISPHFIVVGGEHALEPGVKEELERLIAELGIREHTMMAGFQSDVPRWMQACDVIVHCSTGIEPFGTVIVEAMSLGKKTIAAKAGGPCEIIQDRVNGRLTTPGNIAELADAIVEMIPDNRQNQQMQQAAKERAAAFSAIRLAGDLALDLKKISDQR